MDRLSQSLSRTSDEQVKNKTSVTGEPSPLHLLWGEYVHRAKVHELLRCLEMEHKKLEVLRENLSIKAQEGLTWDDFKQPTPPTDETEEEIRAESRTKEPRLSADLGPVERKKAAALAAQTPDHETNLQKAENASRSVMKLIENNQNITDEQFKRLLELCKDNKERALIIKQYKEKKQRQKYLPNGRENRRMLYDFLNSRSLQLFMLAVIFLSTLVLLLLSFEQISHFYSFHLIMLDATIMAVFVVEAVLKIYIYKADYWRNVSNCLDFFIIVVHFVEILVHMLTITLAMLIDISHATSFRFLTGLRALRVLRVIKFLPTLQVILSTIVQSLLSISSIAVLMVLFMFVFAVAGRELFREEDPKRFGNILATFLTLFQLLTLDDWGDVWEAGEQSIGRRRLKFGYLFLYIIIENFVFLNLFVAVLVDNFQQSIEAASVSGGHEEEIERMQNCLESNDDDSTLAALHYRRKERIKELGIESYGRVPKDSREAVLLSDNMKKLAAIDFHYWMWNRRMRLISIVLETAVQDRGFTLTSVDGDLPIALSRTSSATQSSEGSAVHPPSLISKYRYGAKHESFHTTGTKPPMASSKSKLKKGSSGSKSKTFTSQAKRRYDETSKAKKMRQRKQENNKSKQLPNQSPSISGRKARVK